MLQNARQTWLLRLCTFSLVLMSVMNGAVSRADGHTSGGGYDASTGHDTRPQPSNAAPVDSLFIPKEGDAYYPNNPAFYVGGDIYTILAAAEDTGGALLFLDFYVPPRDVLPQHIHAHEAESKYILEGQVTFEFGTTSLTSPAGTFVHYALGKQMGFTAIDQPARLAVLVTPGAIFYELAGVPVVDAQGEKIAPPAADLFALQQQVDFGHVARINDIYGGSLFLPGISPPPEPGLLDTIVVLPSFEAVDPAQLSAVQGIEGLSVFELSDRPTFTDQFGAQHVALLTFAETAGRLEYSQFSLAPQATEEPSHTPTGANPAGELYGQATVTTGTFPEPVVSQNHHTIMVTAGELLVQLNSEIKVAPRDTFIYISPGQTYVIANVGKSPATAIMSTVVDSYVPKIGEYYVGNRPFTGTVLDGDEYIQGNVVSTVPKAIGEGWIYTWGAFDEQGNPTSVGITFTQEVLNDAFVVQDPDDEFPRLVPHLAYPELFDPARIFNIAFPQRVQENTPFNHVSFQSNSEGHAPVYVLDQPHFDIYFFLSTVEEREFITGLPEDDTNLLNFPEEGFLPNDFIPLTVPGTNIPAAGGILQGMGWVYQLAPELSGAEFNQIFTFGTYAGRVNFWGPMVTKELFEDLTVSGQITNMQVFAIRQPKRFLKAGFYPLTYSIFYNGHHGEYSIAFDNLTFRTPEAQEPMADVPAVD